MFDLAAFADELEKISGILGASIQERSKNPSLLQSHRNLQNHAQTSTGLGVGAGAIGGTIAGGLGASALASKVKNPKLKAALGIGGAVAGALGGGVLGGRTARRRQASQLTRSRQLVGQHGM